MSQTKDAILQDIYLQARAKILELAAMFDRIDAGSDGEQPIVTDTRLQKLNRSLTILSQDGENISKSTKAEQIQLIFSRSYDPDWLETLKPAPRQNA